MDRRTFLRAASAATAGWCMTSARAGATGANPPDYRGPNVIILRFGGGVRRRETLDPQRTYCPWFLKHLVPQGAFFPQMELSEMTQVNGKNVQVVTSHGQGTLNILTGMYDEYEGVSRMYPERYAWQLFDDRFEARVPTLFESLRKSFNVPAHQALLINSEDRKDEEFYSFSNHHLFGVNYKCEVLSLYRFKTHLLRKKIEAGEFDGEQRAAKETQLQEMLALDYRSDERGVSPEIHRYWDQWAEDYGETGLVNERGDRLLTDLMIRAMKQLRPKLMMVNFTDPDYVHWGNVNHYTRAIAIIDQQIRKIYEAVQRDEEYRDNTIFAIVPDCGRDNARLTNVPCQHHFGDRTCREIFALLVGPGIEKNCVVDKPVEQIAIAPTLGRLMGAPTPHAQGDVLESALA